MPSAVTSTPVTSWWYGQGRAVDVVRRLESLRSVTPAPSPAGVVTVRHDDLTVTFVDGLKAPLPQPWQPAAAEARIDWAAAVDPDTSPDPAHPVYLVALGTTGDGALLALNLAAFSRIRITGDPDTARALVSRWTLELLATHPATTIAVSADVWRGPLTNRIQPVAAGRVPDVDVLVLGAGLTYAERAQIVAVASSPILLDLGEDAAVTANWTITCGPDLAGQISNNARPGKPMTATLIIPGAEVIELCADMVANPASGSQPNRIDPVSWHETTPTTPGDTYAPALVDDAGPLPPVIDPSGPPAPPVDTEPPAADGVDFFAPQPAAPDFAPITPQMSTDTSRPAEDNADTEQPGLETSPQTPEPAAALTPAPARRVEAALIWNRILGQVELRPPHGGQPGDREKRLNELTVFLQRHPWATSSEIIKRIYGSASENTVQQQISMLRTRLGAVRPGGPKALPPMREGEYHLDNTVRSDWMEFERLVEILVETTETPNLIAAMDLVTGIPFGGIGAKEWEWSKDLREEIRDRVAEAAVVLARRHRTAGQFGTAVETARKGLWYDTARQDLWQVALTAALDGHDKNTFRTLRSQYLAEIPGPERDPAVFDLTGRSG
jgi:hypothetical protein